MSRCVAYPFNAKQPTDMTKRQLKVSKQQLESLQQRFQVNKTQGPILVLILHTRCLLIIDDFSIFLSLASWRQMSCVTNAELPERRDAHLGRRGFSQRRSELHGTFPALRPSPPRRHRWRPLVARLSRCFPIECRASGSFSARYRRSLQRDGSDVLDG